MPTTKTRKPKTAEAAPPVSNVPVFTKRNILTFQRYAKRRDLLSVLLEDGKEYTMEQVDSLLQNFFKKGKVHISTSFRLRMQAPPSLIVVLRPSPLK